MGSLPLGVIGDPPGAALCSGQTQPAEAFSTKGANVAGVSNTGTADAAFVTT
eukprot:CAMPEP_0172867120 /NCGR_PEP_ID=MMETSP1075-20121228/82695_1 /TAXON_ID=2916 /ORGANISM="Ceratium fusus, Strain PA161109" /LENGTH=51 /DNA_ID=CAMNT_0013716387 /DNA_START=126 /DNA_END=278 /DNA_ORIENTATION=+